MTFLEMVEQAKEGQEYYREYNNTVSIKFLNDILLGQFHEPPVLRREDILADDWVESILIN